MIKNATISPKADRLRLALGLVLGVAAAVFVAIFLIQAKDENAGGQISGDTVPVVVAAQDIAAGTRITADMVTAKQMPASVVLTGALTDASAVIDKVATVPLVAGEQVLTAKVSEVAVDFTKFKGDVPLALVIPQGKRAFSIEVSEVSAAGGLIRPGNYVDVIASGQTVSATDSQETIGTACYVAQDIEVLAVAQTAVKSLPGAVETPDEMAAVSTETGATSVTLAVTPQEAAAIAANQRGVDGTSVTRQVWLSLRPIGEHGANADLPACE